MNADLERLIYTCDRNAQEWRDLEIPFGEQHHGEAECWQDMAESLRGLGDEAAQPLDRSEAVNLARNYIDMGGYNITPKGIAMLANAVLDMDEAIALYVSREGKP